MDQHFKRIRRKNSAGVDRILTASGTHGLVDQQEFFNRRVASSKVDRYYHLKQGEFAYNRSSMNGYPFGAIKRLDDYEEGVLSTLYICFALRPESAVDSDFATFLFESNQLNRELSSICAIGARAHGLLNVTPSDFFKISFQLPPLPEQRKIAAILSSVDDAIATTRKVIEQTKRVKHGLLQALMTRGIGHTRFKRTEVGEIPETWEVVGTEGLFDRLRVPRTLDRSSCSEAGSTRILDQSEAEWFGYHEGEPDLHADENTPLVTFANHTCAVRYMTLPFSVIQNVFPLRPLHDVDPRFLYWSLCGAIRQDGYRGHWPQVKRLKFAKPPLAEQRRIRSHIDAVAGYEEAGRATVERLRQVRRGVMQDLLTGRVRVQSA